MKRKIMLPIAALAFCGTIIITTSCQKEENKETIITASEKNQQSAEDQAVEKRILAFKESTQNPTKDVTEIPVDEALWNIEAALNYTYCMGAGAAVDPEVEETQIQFSLNENELLNFTDVANEYLNLAAANELKQSDLEAEGKEFKLVNLTDITTPEEFSEGKVIFKVTTIDGIMPEEGGSNRLNEYTFGESDNWYYGEGLGKYPSGYEGWDAARLFTNVINYGSPAFDPTSIPAKKGFYTSTESVPIDYYSIQFNYRNPDDDSLDNIHDFLIFCKNINYNNGSQPLDIVLRYNDYDEMNFYYQGLLSIKNDLDEQFYSSGKEFKCIKIIYRNIKDYNKYQKIWHEPTYWYGIYHQGSHN